MAYWLDLFTWKTWQEFLKAGGTVSGFRESRWKTVSRMRPGDKLLCYLTGVSRWVGVLEVTGDPYQDSEPIWSEEEFPARVPVSVLLALDVETAVPVSELKDKLSYFQNTKGPLGWTGHFRGSPTREKVEDARHIIKAIEEAKANPVHRPFDEKKLHRRVKAYPTNTGSTMTIPEDDVEEVSAKTADVSHEEIQWHLLKLGNDLGLDLWVARNDKRKTFKGQTLSSLPQIVPSLPTQFDAATQRTVELIDVLWLKGKTIVAAFEVEHTTSIYSGLLRMADLISMQPNINIKLYLVAPEARRDKVCEEIGRPTFQSLPQALAECCQYLSYENLKAAIAKAENLASYLDPGFLDEFAEVVTVE